MENNLEEIPIFFAIDDNYMPLLAVALESLIANSSKQYEYAIKILHTNIKEESKKRILKYAKSNVKIEFVDLNYYIEEVKDKLFTRDYYTKTTYFRLFIPNLYPQYTKAIYLDCDIVVLGDIAELYHQDIGTNLVAAAPDDVIQTTPIFQEYVEKVVGIASYKNYFNAGVLLMNLDELRKFDFQNKFLYLLETVKFAVVQDQDYLNRLCKGRTKILSQAWDRMPIKTNQIPEEDIKLIHYNLNYKPWYFDNILYSDYFWKYAKKTEYYGEILKMKENYTEEKRFQAREQYRNLEILAKKESSCVGDDRKLRQQYENEYEFDEEKRNLLNVFKWKRKEQNDENLDEVIEKSADRLAVLERIENMEKNGIFDVDAEDDPPAIQLNVEDVDYLNKKSSSKIKTKVANRMGEYYLDKILKDKRLIIKDVNGIENLLNVQTGAIITCNHFNPFDSFAIEEVFRRSGLDKEHKLYKVIREGNYTNFPGLYGFFFRNCDTLPLSSSNQTMMEFMRAVDIILQRKDFVLIYPEQSMWWNYRKPKPLKNGAFKLAIRSNVPVIPIFITMEDSTITGEDGFPIQAYTINIKEPIYPDAKLKDKENVSKMLKKNEAVWKEVYEDFYGMPLKYSTEEKSEAANS